MRFRARRTSRATHVTRQCRLAHAGEAVDVKGVFPVSALPKRKIQQGRRNRRRSHLALKPRQLVACAQCHEPHMPHHVCPNCGTYNGVEVIEVKEKSKRKKE
jgi:large subunit ribosomal protein L32